MFESLVSTYPRRVDLWAVYTDMMIKLGDTQKVRSAKKKKKKFIATAVDIMLMLDRYIG